MSATLVLFLAWAEFSRCVDRNARNLLSFERNINYIHGFERVTSEDLISGGHVVCAQSFSSDVHSGSLFIDE